MANRHFTDILHLGEYDCKRLGSEQIKLKIKVHEMIQNESH